MSGHAIFLVLNLIIAAALATAGSAGIALGAFLVVEGVGYYLYDYRRRKKNEARKDD